MDLRKREIVKDVIKSLHAGLSAEAAKEKIIKEAGTLTSMEIAEIEQSLIQEGVSTDEIKSFCNVHALIFEASIENSMQSPDTPSHPVNLFIQENKAIKRITADVRVSAESFVAPDPDQKKKIIEKITMLLDIRKHYERKEQLLFPFLEKAGFTGPSKVMWGKHNDIRELLKRTLRTINEVETSEQLANWKNENLLPLLEEVDGMIFKEENILFPASLEKLTAQDWTEILRQSPEIGYVYIQVPEEAMFLKKNMTALSEPGTLIGLGSGSLRIEQLVGIFSVLPVDITFIDHEDTVQFYSNSKDRIFTRTNSVLGRKVQNCHPPQSVNTVNAILENFRTGKKDSAEFWIDMGPRKIHIRYFAVRDPQRTYLGTLEVTQDITPLQKIEGQRRLYDEKS
jgi:DUF438 domain-containing protein